MSVFSFISNWEFGKDEMIVKWKPKFLSASANAKTFWKRTKAIEIYSI